MIRVVRTAFVLGAGLGTRLRPLTNRRPKPLIPVVNRPLIAHTFDRLLAESIEALVVNTHWAAEAYATAFPEASYGGVPLEPGTTESLFVNWLSCAAPNVFSSVQFCSSIFDVLVLSETAASEYVGTIGSG